MRINFTKIEILEVKMGVQVSKNINHFRIGDASNANGYKLPPTVEKIKKPANTNPQIFYRMNLHQLMFKSHSSNGGQ